MSYKLLEEYLVPKSMLIAGSLFLTGKNSLGQLGISTTTSKSSPVQTVSGGTNWKQVSCADDVTSAIKTDGTLWMWGVNSNGQLGDNTVSPRSSPIQTVAAGNNWKQVSIGGPFSGAIKTDGTLWLWGANGSGQLGDNTTAHKSSPVQTIAGGTNWKMIACGGGHAAAIKTDGTLWTWGYNFYAALGDNTLVSKSSPVQTISGGTNWKYVSGGLFSTHGIKTDGTLWSWGYNNYGQLGDGTTIDKSSPVQTVAGGTNWKTVAGSNNQSITAAIKTDNTLWLWGNGSFGQLGDNTLASKSSPIQTIAGGTNWKSVSSGGGSTGAIKTDGTLWVWGSNGFGELGDNTVIGKSSPVQTVAGGNAWKSVSVGINHTVMTRES